MNYISKQKTHNPPKYELSYNEEYHDVLSKNVILPIIQQSGCSQLLHMVEQNKNASVSTSTGQLIDGLDNIKQHKLDNKQDLAVVSDKISKLKQEVKALDTEITEDYIEDINEMKKEWSKYIAHQKKENAKLKREVETHIKEISNINTQIYYLLGKINLMEKQIGLKNKDYGYYEDNLFVGTEEARFIIKTENI